MLHGCVHNIAFPFLILKIQEGIGNVQFKRTPLCFWQEHLLGVSDAALFMVVLKQHLFICY